jgi:hypothetical protein
MFARSLSKLFPAIAVTALLCLAAAAPSRQASVAPPPQLQPPCDDYASAVTGDDTVAIRNGTGIEQALPAGMSVAACSLRTSTAYYAFATMELNEWDPTLLAPDPGAVALRRTFFDASRILWAGNHVPHAVFVPPVVLTSVPGVAEPPQPQVAIKLIADAASWFNGYFTPDGPAELPAATRVSGDGARTPLPGPHPVLAHAVCAANEDLA